MTDDEIQAAIERAKDEVCGLASGARRWTMRFPVEERDSDLVIMAGLNVAHDLLATRAALRELVEATNDLVIHGWDQVSLDHYTRHEHAMDAAETLLGVFGSGDVDG